MGCLLAVLGVILRNSQILRDLREITGLGFSFKKWASQNIYRLSASAHTVILSFLKLRVAWKMLLSQCHFRRLCNGDG